MAVAWHWSGTVTNTLDVTAVEDIAYGFCLDGLQTVISKPWHADCEGQQLPRWLTLRLCQLSIDPTAPCLFTLQGFTPPSP